MDDPKDKSETNKKQVVLNLEFFWFFRKFMQKDGSKRVLYEMANYSFIILILQNPRMLSVAHFLPVIGTMYWILKKATQNREQRC